MKKVYNAPTLECLAFFSATSIGNDEDLALVNNGGSNPWNDGELNWGDNWT